MKKLLCFTLVLSLMFSMLTVGPLFSFGETAVMDTLSPAYTVSGASCFPGETVELYVAIENNPGIISLRCQISYNDYALELVDIENLSLLEGFTSPPASLSSSSGSYISTLDMLTETGMLCPYVSFQRFICAAASSQT